MILGMSTAAYTFWHTLISVIGIGSGLIVAFGFLTHRRFVRTSAVFLVTTALTSITGFGFPFQHLLPSHKVGIISLVVLAVAIPALYIFHLAGAWRWIYVVTASTALYLNFFVLVVQLFRKIPALTALAPTQTEPPFLFAQVIVLGLYLALLIFGIKKFRFEPDFQTLKAA